MNGSAVEVVDDLMVLDTEIFLWFKPVITGKPPCARSGHTACLMDGNNLVIFGGSVRIFESTPLSRRG